MLKGFVTPEEEEELKQLKAEIRKGKEDMILLWMEIKKDVEDIEKWKRRHGISW